MRALRDRSSRSRGRRRRLRQGLSPFRSPAAWILWSGWVRDPGFRIHGLGFWVLGFWYLD